MAVSGDLLICKKGHYYEPERSECPICKREREAGTTGYIREEDEKTALKGIRYVERNRSAKYDFDAEVTVAASALQKGFHPIAGWLVCVEGEEKGKDYRIRNGRNYIGRDYSMDICILGDETISRINHASVSFDDRTNKYFYTPGTGRSIDHINGAPVFETQELNTGDCIEIGSTKFAFVPLCCGRFNWEDFKEEEQNEETK